MKQIPCLVTFVKVCCEQQKFTAQSPLRLYEIRILTSETVVYLEPLQGRDLHVVTGASLSERCTDVVYMYVCLCAIFVLCMYMHGTR